MENCLVTKLKGSVDNSDLKFDYLDGIIVNFPAGQVSDCSLLIVPGSSKPKVHFIKGKLYSDEERTTEIADNYIVGSQQTFYPSLTEETSVVLFNKYEGITTLSINRGRLKVSNFEGIRTLNDFSVTGAVPGGGFLEGSTELLDIVKTIYNDKTAYKSTAWDKGLYPDGLLYRFVTSQLLIKGVPNLAQNFQFRFTTAETPASGNYYIILKGPVDVYANSEEHVLTYNPLTDEVTYYGRFA